ncbi:MAG: amidoligase family protein [Armatimonadota bacterium]
MPYTVDGSHFDGRTLANLMKIFYKQQELIIQALGVRADRLAKYTKRIDPDLIRRIDCKRPKTLDEMNKLWYGAFNSSPQHYDSQRYYVAARIMLRRAAIRAARLRIALHNISPCRIW